MAEFLVCRFYYQRILIYVYFILFFITDRKACEQRQRRDITTWCLRKTHQNSKIETQLEQLGHNLSSYGGIVGIDPGQVYSAAAFFLPSDPDASGSQVALRKRFSMASRHATGDGLRNANKVGDHFCRRRDFSGLLARHLPRQLHKLDQSPSVGRSFPAIASFL